MQAAELLAALSVDTGGRTGPELEVHSPIDGVKIDQFSRGDNGGVLAFTGDIQSITLGGQELAVDNVVARVPAPSAVGLLGCAGLAAMRRRR